MRAQRKLATPSGIGAGQTATLNLPIGNTYHRLDLRMKASTGADAPVDVAAADWVNYIDDIRLYVNGDVKIEMDAAYAVARPLFFGETIQPGVLPIFLGMPWARTIGGENDGAYGTVGLASVTLEVDFKDAINIGHFRVHADVAPPEPFGTHLRIQRFGRSFASVGREELADFPLGAYQAAAIDFTTADIGEVEIEGNGSELHQSDAAIRANKLGIAGRVPQAGFTHLDLMAENQVNLTMPMAWQDFRVKADFTAAPGAYSVYLTSLAG